MRNAMLSALRGYIAGMFVLMLCFLHSLYLSVLSLSFSILLSVCCRPQSRKRQVVDANGRTLFVCVCVYWINRLRGRGGGGGGVFLERGLGNVFPKTMSFQRDLALTS